MRTKACLIVIGTAAALLVIGAVVGNVLESAGVLTRETLGPKGIAAVKILFVLLFCIFGFAAVPLLIQYFIHLQIRIGNAEAAPIRWLQAHERGVVYACWSLIVAGLAMGLPAALRHGFFK
jgi:hypothetical protein